MSREDEIIQIEKDSKVLEDFLIGNEDLERLEALLDRFNIFEAIGVVRQELRHSDFLAFLLNPRGNHGLEDVFAKRLLQKVLMNAGDASVPVTPIMLELWSLDRIEVRREWQHIDILLLDEKHMLAVIIENKIDTSEHSDQLRRYYEIVEQRHPGWRVIGLYLTPGGEAPSHEAYLPVDYGLLCDVIDGVAAGRASVVNQDVKILLTHYTEMLRRNIVGDSEIARLCRQIYRKHRRALDLIYEHRLGALTEIKEMVGALVDAEPGFEIDSIIKNKTRFAFLEWDQPALLTAEGWSKSNRVLLFEFWYYPDDLRLYLFIGPGPEEIRQRLFHMVESRSDTFRRQGSWSGENYTVIYSAPFLEGEEMLAEPKERDEKIRRRWSEFLRQDLPRMDAALKGERWMWESAGSNEEPSSRSDRFVWRDGDIEITHRPDQPND